MPASPASPGPAAHLPDTALRALLRAGAFGAWHGGHPGRPEVGLTVPVGSGAEWRTALAALADAGAQATLLVPASLDADLRAATRAGHELAGAGVPRHVTRLEAEAGQAVTAWDAAGLGPADVRRLAGLGLHPLPLPARRAEPGQVLRVPPAELAATLGHLKALGFRAVPVRALPDLRPGTPRDLLGHLYQRVVEDRYAERSALIDLSGRYDAVMKVAPLDHAPDPLPLPRATPTAELHLNSARLVGLASFNLLGTYRAYQRSLKDVARALKERPELHGAQAVFAVTLFHGPLEKSGFQLLDLPPARARLYGLGFRLLRMAYGTTRTPSEGTPKMAWLPRDEFLKRYG